mgnify:CR=1 FL=1
MVSSVSGSGYSGISGLVSGLDTESMVKKMTAASLAKIDKVNQQKQLLLWKQEDYKSIISKLMSFKDKYFDTLSGSSTLSRKLYSSKTAAPLNPEDSKYASVTISGQTNISAIELRDIKTATNSRAVSLHTVSRQIVIGFDQASVPVDLTGKTLDITVDGLTKTITFSKAYYSSEELGADIKALTDAAFGVDRLSVSVSGDEIIINSDGVDASLSPGPVDSAFEAEGLSLINDHTSRLDLLKSVSENNFAVPVVGDTLVFSINGKQFEFQKDASIASIMNAINASDAGVKISYSSITDKFTLTSGATGAANSITISDETGNFLAAVIGPLTAENYTEGTDASVYINGTKVTRSSNTFTIDGITYSLKADNAGTINMSITDDTQKVIANIKDFVKDYNDILDAINSKISEARYRDFAPLTDEQKKELSESEIKQWEEKAKSGLLRNDSNLMRLIQSLRAAFYMPVKRLDDNSENIGINIADIGITTDAYTAKGRLIIDEEKLAKALASDPESVIKLFTQQSDKLYLPDAAPEDKAERYNESGIMQRLSDILSDNIRKTYGGGILLKIAGYPGSSLEFENSITNKIKSYEQKLSRLLESLTREENRYFSQFTAMEKYIAQMNQQAMWLSNTFD